MGNRKFNSVVYWYFIIVIILNIVTVIFEFNKFIRISDNCFLFNAIAHTILTLLFCDVALNKRITSAYAILMINILSGIVVSIIVNSDEWMPWNLNTLDEILSFSVLGIYNYDTIGLHLSMFQVVVFCIILVLKNSDGKSGWDILNATSNQRRQNRIMQIQRALNHCLDIEECVDAIKTILDSHFLGEEAGRCFIYKTHIDWGYLRSCMEMQKKRATYGYEEREYEGVASDYVLELGYSLVHEGVLDYSKWKQEMVSHLSFLKNYPYASCDDSDMENIVDCAWNSYINGMKIVDTAYLYSPWYKRLFHNRITIKVLYIAMLIIEFLLMTCVSFDYLMSIIAPVAVATIYMNKAFNHALFPLSLIIYNYLCVFIYIANDYAPFLVEGDLRVDWEYSPLNTVHIMNAILLVAAVILHINSHDQISKEKAEKYLKRG